MGAVFGIGYLAVMLVIFVAVSSAIRKGVREGKTPARTAKPLPRLKEQAQRGAAGPARVRAARPSRNRSPKSALPLSGHEKSGKLVDSPVLLEDREHDWLAKQLREEAKLMRRGDMLDLGANHSKSCDAKRVKTYHILEHDDSIDNGEL